MPKIRYRIAAFVVMLSMAGFCGQAAELPRDVTWRQFQTDHFVIIYPAAYRAIAEQVGSLAESIQQELSQLFDVAQMPFTSVIIADHLDRVDRWQLDLLRRLDPAVMLLVLGDPLTRAPTFDLPTRDRLMAQFIYQYTYVWRSALNDFCRELVGSYFYQDAGFAAWMDGGLGLWALAQLAGGAGTAPFLDMFLRAEVAADLVGSLAQRAAFGFRAWPGDLGAVVAGYSFLQYLTATYGNAELIQLIQTQSHLTPLPFGEKDVFRAVYGQSLRELQEAWQANLRAVYQAQIQRIQAAPITATSPVSAAAAWSDAPVFAPDGQTAYYLADSPHDHQAIVQVRLADGQQTRLTEGHFVGRLAIAPNGKYLYFSKTEVSHTYYQYSDVYQIDVTTRQVTRLTNGARALDPAVSPDGRTLVYGVNDARQAALMQLDLLNGVQSPVFTLADRGTIRQPAFSADGQYLAFQVLQTTGQQDIYLATTDWQHIRPLFADLATDASPAWGLHDQYLFFMSTRSGVPNIFAYRLRDQQLFQVTNLLTGGFEPTIAPDGARLLFTEYTVNGMQIVQTDLTPAIWRAFTTPPDAAPCPSTAPLTPIANINETRYHPLPSMFPGVIPMSGSDEEGLQLGLYFSGADVLAQHAYGATFWYGLNSGRLAVAGQYLNKQFYPTIGVFAYDRAAWYADLFRNPYGGRADYWERQQGGGVTIEVPLYRTHRTELSWNVGYEYQQVASLMKAGDLAAPLPAEGSLGNASSRLLLKSFDRYRFSISPENGVLTSLRYRRYDEIFGSDYTIDEVTGDLNLFLKTPFQHHVLLLRGAGGISAGDTLQQGVFQLGGFVLAFENDLLAEPRFDLRGYASNAFTGDRFILSSAEYRLPLWYLQRTTLRGLLFLDSLSASFFADAGDAWHHENDANLDLKYSAGGELCVNVGYLHGRLPVGVKIGGAHGFDAAHGQTQLYLKFNLAL